MNERMRQFVTGGGATILPITGGNTHGEPNGSQREHVSNGQQASAIRPSRGEIASSALVRPGSGLFRPASTRPGHTHHNSAGVPFASAPAFWEGSTAGSNLPATAETVSNFESDMPDAYPVPAPVGMVGPDGLVVNGGPPILARKTPALGTGERISSPTGRAEDFDASADDSSTYQYEAQEPSPSKNQRTRQHAKVAMRTAKRHSFPESRPKQRPHSRGRQNSGLNQAPAMPQHAPPPTGYSDASDEAPSRIPKKISRSKAAKSSSLPQRQTHHQVPGSVSGDSRGDAGYEEDMDDDIEDYAARHGQNVHETLTTSNFAYRGSDAESVDRQTTPKPKVRKPAEIVRKTSVTLGQNLPYVTVESKAVPGPKKRHFELDYDDSVLATMSYKQLQSESFDHVPSQEEVRSARNPSPGSLEEKLAHFEGRDQVAQEAFFKDMSLSDWNKSGDWLLGRFGDVMHRFTAARAEKRAVVESFEREVAKRHEDVERKTREIGQTLDAFKTEGLKMMEKNRR